MAFAWIHESSPTWDDHKNRLVGGAAPGTFRLAPQSPGGVAPGEWWRVEEDGAVVGYGWMDVVWGEGEVLLVVSPSHRDQGAGTFIVDRLEAEAASRGLAYIYNTVSPTHPDRERVTAWLLARGFARGHDDERLERRVRSTR
jgi:N-acetylglutamate synthase-like GNAT family acetyltransferase